MTNSVFSERLKSEGVMLALLPFLGSLAAFAFECGYLEFFSVPVEVMDIGLNHIVWAIIWFSIPSAGVWWICVRLYALLTSEVSLVRNTWGALIGASLVAWAFWMIYHNPILVVALVWVPIFFGMWWLQRLFGEKGTLAETYPELSRVYVGAQRDAARAERYEMFFLGPFSAALVALMLVATTGYWIGKLQRSVWVLVEEPTYFLVRKYGDQYVFKEFDSKTGQLGSSLLVRTASDSKEVRLREITTNGLR